VVSLAFDVATARADANVSTVMLLWKVPLAKLMDSLRGGIAFVTPSALLDLRTVLRGLVGPGTPVVNSHKTGRFAKDTHDVSPLSSSGYWMVTAGQSAAKLDHSASCE
jgi:hypothetical protein